MVFVLDDTDKTNRFISIIQNVSIKMVFNYPYEVLSFTTSGNLKQVSNSNLKGYTILI